MMPLCSQERRKADMPAPTRWAGGLNRSSRGRALGLTAQRSNGEQSILTSETIRGDPQVYGGAPSIHMSRQRASAASPGQISANLCIPSFVLSHSPCLPIFYNRATARNFVLVAIQTNAHAALFSGSGTNDSNCRSIAGASSAPKSVIRITAPRSESRDGRDREVFAGMQILRGTLK